MEISLALILVILFLANCHNQYQEHI